MSNRNRVPAGAERPRLPTIRQVGYLIGHGQQLAAKRLRARLAEVSERSAGVSGLNRPGETNRQFAERTCA